jgi:hypothetical protein
MALAAPETRPVFWVKAAAPWPTAFRDSLHLVQGLLVNPITVWG